MRRLRSPLLTTTALLALCANGVLAEVWAPLRQARSDPSLYIAERENAQCVVSDDTTACWDDHQLADLGATPDGWWAASTTIAERRQRITLYRGEGGMVAEAASLPPSQWSRGAPRLAMDRGEMQGLIWIEGDHQDRFQVVAAPWEKTQWGPLELVSEGGDGSQVAPSIAVLADGSWLLLWTRYDGEDDEIVFSVRRDGRWSDPQRLHPDNGAPDVLPVVTRFGRGAIAAWSSFDGQDYRLLTSLFDGTGWEPPFAHPGKGGVDSSFVPVAGEPRLLYRSVVPGRWRVVAFDADGKPRESTSVASESPTRPIVTIGSAADLHFVWPESGERLQGFLDER